MIDQVEAETAFDAWIEPLLLGDVEKTIKAGANYAAALALVSYTEVIGGLKTGLLGVKNESKRNFNAALELFEWNGDPNYYKDFRVEAPVLTKNPDAAELKPLGVYEVFRCGLIHEYFTKGLGLVHNNADRVDHVVPGDQGIGWHKKKLRFHTNAYYRDFKAAIERFRETVCGDASAAGKFMEALRRLQKVAKGVRRPV